MWDARTGFTVPSHLISYAGVVSCQTRLGNETFKSPLYIVAVVGEESFATSEQLKRPNIGAMMSKCRMLLM